MSKLFLVNIDMNGNEIQNVVLQPLATAPANPTVGRIYYDTTDSMLKTYNGTAWTPVGAVVSVNGKVGVVTLTQDDVGNGSTYKRTHNDLTDALVTLINGSLQRSGGTMSGNIAMGGNSITGLAAPSANTDAATKKYADDLVSGLGAVFKFKGTKATTSELPLSGNSQGDVWLVSADSSEYVWTLSAASGTAAGWEKLGVTVDLSAYAPLASPAFTGTPTAPTAYNASPGSQQIANMSAVLDVANNIGVRHSSDTIGTSATTVTVTVFGMVIAAWATQGNSGNQVMVDISIGEMSEDGYTGVTFTVASAPSSTITCHVFSVQYYVS